MKSRFPSISLKEFDCRKRKSRMRNFGKELSISLHLSSFRFRKWCQKNRQGLTLSSGILFLFSYIKLVSAPPPSTPRFLPSSDHQSQARLVHPS